MLADFEIRKALQEGWIDIDPYTDDRLQPVSYDLTLAADIRVRERSVHTVDVGLVAEDHHTRLGRVAPTDGYTQPKTIPSTGWTLHSHDFLLACTTERITLSPAMAARVEGKSSLGRLGLLIHSTAGFIDPGFDGQVTLEVANLAPWAIQLRAGMPIAQICFEPVSMPERDYSKTGRYQGQMGPTESRYTL
jgi:dCTP deaminase